MFYRKFQFHKGTIKTASVRLYRLAAELFQFHKGTIKTIFRANKAIMIDNFNSIKVRLKP